MAEEEKDAETYLEREKRKNQEKDLKGVGFIESENQIQLKKNLYVETKEITSMSEKDVQ